MPRGRQNAQEKREREEFMLSVFRENPDQSVAKANSKFKARFGSMLRNNRAYELRKVAQAEREQAPEPVRRRTSRRCFMVEGEPGQLESAKELLETLREHGVQVEIDHATDTYLIVKV